MGSSLPCCYQSKRQELQYCSCQLHPDTFRAEVHEKKSLNGDGCTERMGDLKVMMLATSVAWKAMQDFAQRQIHPPHGFL